jgi:hypothetical protein
LNALEGEGSEIIVQSTQDIWGKGLKDIQLIKNLNEESGILITHDLRMRTLYRELLKEKEVSAFFISIPSGANFELIYRKIFTIWEEIKKISKKEKHPFVCRMPWKGKYKMI